MAASAFVRVVSIAPHVYDSLDRPVGATYEAEAAHLEVLQRLGYVRPVDEAPAPPPSPSKKRKEPTP